MSSNDTRDETVNEILSFLKGAGCITVYVPCVSEEEAVFWRLSNTCVGEGVVVVKYPLGRLKRGDPGFARVHTFLPPHIPTDAVHVKLSNMVNQLFDGLLREPPG